MEEDTDDSVVVTFPPLSNAIKASSATNTTAIRAAAAADVERPETRTWDAFAVAIYGRSQRTGSCSDSEFSSRYRESFGDVHNDA